VTLPAAVDEKGVTASLVDGVLTVRMTKASGAKTTRIAIR
jgi:HSP20 family molecular chaperone IbpA